MRYKELLEERTKKLTFLKKQIDNERLNVTYIASLLNAIELSEKLGPGFELDI